MYSLLLLSALAPSAAEPSGMAPEQAVASIDAKGKLTITLVACACYGPGSHEVEVQETKGTDKVAAKVKVKTSSVTVTTVELPAKHVEAYTADGRPVDADKLASLLAKERTVLVAMEGKKVDPYHLQLYKDDTIILVPPANTVGMGGPYVGAYGGYGPYGPSVVPAGPPPEPKTPPDDGRKPDPDRKPDTDRKPDPDRKPVTDQKKETR
jgi:hypothetical protein